MEHSNRPLLSMWVKTRQWFKLFFTKTVIGLRGGGRERLAQRQAVKSLEEWNKFYPRFNELHHHILNRMHKKVDYAKMDVNLEAVKRDLRYWEGWNAGLDWAHRILNGDKSAD